MLTTLISRKARLWVAGAAAAGVLAGGAAAGTLVLTGTAAHAKKGADDPAGDNRGKDPQPHAKKGADDPAGDDRGKDPQPHA